MAKSLHCDISYSHIWMRPDGLISPCCKWDNKVFLDKNTGPANLQDFFHSPGYENLRQTLDSGERHPGCKRCWALEDGGMSSLRTHPHLKVDTSVPVLRSLDVAVGRVCNLKCRSCDAIASTAWEAEDRLNGIENDLPELDIADIPDSVLVNLVHLKVTGGEPFLNPRFAVLMDRMAALGSAQHCTMALHTNSTIIPKPEYLRGIRQFKKVLISLSVDGVGERNDYIRSGAHWDKMQTVISRWNELGVEMGDRFHFAISCTFSSLNVIYLEEMIQWMKELRLKFPAFADIRLHRALVTTPAHLRLWDLPEPLKQQIIAKIESAYQKDDWNHLRDFICRALQRKNTVPSNIPALMRETRRLDRQRNQCLERSLPELAELLRPWITTESPEELPG